MFTCKICKRDGLTTPADLPGGPICPRCADRLAQTAPRLLAACEAAEELLSRLRTPGVAIQPSQQLEMRWLTFEHLSDYKCAYLAQPRVSYRRRWIE